MKDKFEIFWSYHAMTVSNPWGKMTRDVHVPNQESGTIIEIRWIPKSALMSTRNF